MLYAKAPQFESGREYLWRLHMSSKTKSIGDIGVSKIIELGINVSIPFGDNCDYDMVID